VAAVFYYSIKNPSQLSSLGLDPQSTKSYLQAFARIFFGLIVFGSMAMIITNGYRLATLKNVAKGKYAI